MEMTDTKTSAVPTRTIDRIVTVPPAGPGFGGDAHTAAPVIAPGEFEATDPFFLMMDDRISRAGPFGEEHPHAGLETITFILEGASEDLGGRLEKGDVEWMTAGAGIVHAEELVVTSGMRLLQLWVVLPENQRQVSPRVQILSQDRMQVRRERGVEARVYSGRSGDIVASATNAVPMTLVDIRLEPGTGFEQLMPSSFRGFIVVLDGEVEAGTPLTSVHAGQVGWTHPVMESGESSLAIVSGKTGARFLLYAGEPQNIRLAARGPFIAGSEAELNSLFASYRNGRFPRASSIPAMHA